MESIREENKNKIKKTIICFFAGMLILTFLSNTINNISLPKVTVKKLTSGTLTRHISGTGNIEARKSTKVYQEEGRVVNSVLVSLGQKVHRGQKLMTFKDDDIKLQLQQENVKLKQCSLQVEKNKTQLNFSLKDLKRKLADAEEKMKVSQRDLENIKELYGKGYETKDNYLKTEASYNEAKRDADEAEDNINKAIESGNEDIKGAVYDMETEIIAIQKLKDSLMKSVLYASADGVVKELNYQEGDSVVSGKAAVLIADEHGGYQFRMGVSAEDAKYVNKGDSIDINLEAFDGYEIRGVVDSIQNKTDGSDGKDVIARVSEKKISGDERGEGYIDKELGSYPLIISSSAVNSDSSGSFVWVLEEDTGALGNHYKVRRYPVKIGTKDADNTAVLGGITDEDTVITGVEDDKVLTDGCSVSLSE